MGSLTHFGPCWMKYYLMCSSTFNAISARDTPFLEHLHDLQNNFPRFFFGGGGTCENVFTCIEASHKQKIIK